MIITPRIFRVGVITAMLAVVIGFFFDSFVSNAAVSYLAHLQRDVPSAATALRFGGAILVLGGYVSQVIAAIGLYGFKPWARKVALAGIVLSIVGGSLIGYNLHSGASGALMDLGNLLWGAVVALAFGSSISARFNDGGADTAVIASA